MISFREAARRHVQLRAVFVKLKNELIMVFLPLGMKDNPDKKYRFFDKPKETKKVKRSKPKEVKDEILELLSK